MRSHRHGTLRRHRLYTAWRESARVVWRLQRRPQQTQSPPCIRSPDTCFRIGIKIGAATRSWRYHTRLHAADNSATATCTLPWVCGLWEKDLLLPAQWAPHARPWLMCQPSHDAQGMELMLALQLAQHFALRDRLQADGAHLALPRREIEQLRPLWESPLDRVLLYQRRGLLIGSKGPPRKPLRARDDDGPGQANDQANEDADEQRLDQAVSETWACAVHALLRSMPQVLETTSAWQTCARRPTKSGAFGRDVRAGRRALGTGAPRRLPA
mmetsp:Transcript_55750/g.156450  ORF Transcript_55750/g.156450 Transcript_55750/m.156450 type:complete len:270 (-) Transcript_55750:31-840(-)